MSAECFTHGIDMLGANADYCPLCDLALVKHDFERLREAAQAVVSADYLATDKLAVRCRGLRTVLDGFR